MTQQSHKLPTAQFNICSKFVSQACRQCQRVKDICSLVNWHLEVTNLLCQHILFCCKEVNSTLQQYRWEQNTIICSFQVSRLFSHLSLTCIQSQLVILCHEVKLVQSFLNINQKLYAQLIFFSESKTTFDNQMSNCTA